MKKILLVLSIILTFNVSLIAFPILSNFEISTANPNRIYFESSEEISGSTITGFDLRDREGIIITGITINGSQLTGHYFTVSTPFSWYHNNTLKYDGGSNIQGESESLPKFDLQYIQNNISIPNVTGTEYYVDASVGSSGSGLNEADAFKTIQEGINQLITAGDKLWIKAGNYGNERIGFPTHLIDGEWVGYKGTVDNPFYIEGYKNTPGDITSLYYTYGDGMLDSTEMPLLNGGSNGAEAEHVAINFADYQEYYIVKNIQIQNYHEGILGGKDTNKFRLENLLIKDIGVLGRDYGGRGIALETWDQYRCHYIRIKNCIVIDAEQDAILSQGDNNFYDNCKAYSQATDNDPYTNSRVGTDYYFRFELGNNNIMRNCLAYKDRELGHVGHGFSNKKATEHNLVEYCTAINIIWSFQARHSASKYNVFRNCEAHANISNRRRGQYNSYSGGINVMCGANNNIFDKIHIHDVDLGFHFYKNSEDNENSTDIGHDNIFRNIIIDNIVHEAILMRNFENASASFNNNKFYNITINKINYQEPPVKDFEHDEGAIQGGFFEWDNEGNITATGNEITNTTTTDCPLLNVYSTTSSGFLWNHNNFYNSFTIQGTNALTVDPMFVDATSGDFHLQDDSPLVDAGIDLPSVIFDFESNQRPNASSYDIGAYENQFGVTATIEDDAENAILLYPNPSTGIVKINLSTLYLGKTILKLTSLNGKIVFQKEIINPKNLLELNFSEIEKGIYFIELNNQNKILIKKVVLF